MNALPPEINVEALCVAPRSFGTMQGDSAMSNAQRSDGQRSLLMSPNDTPAVPTQRFDSTFMPHPQRHAVMQRESTSAPAMSAPPVGAGLSRSTTLSLLKQTSTSPKPGPVTPMEPRAIEHVMSVIADRFHVDIGQSEHTSWALHTVPHTERTSICDHECTERPNTCSNRFARNVARGGGIRNKCSAVASRS